MTAFSLVLAQYRREATALGIGVTLAVFALLIGLPYLLGLLELHEGTVVVLVLLACAVIGSAIYLKSEPKDSRAMRGIALGVASASGIISIVAGGILLLFFGASIEGPSFFIYLLFTTLTLLFAFVAMLVFWRQLRPGKAVLSAFAGMNGLTVLVFPDVGTAGVRSHLCQDLGIRLGRTGGNRAYKPPEAKTTAWWPRTRSRGKEDLGRLLGDAVLRGPAIG